MSKINLNNYEAYYLDYLEGNLSAEDTAQLLLFLEQHPALKSELDDFEILELNADEGIRFDKSSLHQNINETNVDDYLIASIENIINHDDAEELAEYIKKTPVARTLADRYKNTILPKQIFLYPKKSELKQKNRAVIYLAPIVSVAAAAAIFIWLNLPNNNTPQNNQIQSAQVDKNQVGSNKQLKVVQEHNVPANETNELKPMDTTKSEPVKKPAVTIKKVPVKNFFAQTADSTVKETIILPQQIAETKDTVINKHIEQPANEYLAGQQGDTSYAAGSLAVNNSLKEQAEKTDTNAYPVLDKTSKEILLAMENQKKVSPQPSSEVLTISQLARKTIRKNILRVNKPSNETMEGKEILEAVVTRIDENSRTNVAYNYKNTQKLTTYTISIGRVELTRTKVK